MANAVPSSSLQPSFYSSVADMPRDDLLLAYRRFLEQRNGDMDFTKGFSRREAWLSEAAGWSTRYAGEVDNGTFARAYSNMDEARRLPLPVLALLAFAKANSAEAYGVEVVDRAREKRRDSSRLFDQVERLLGYEEKYHTRILIGATQHFGVEEPGAWKPTLSLRLLIGTLAYAPGVLFHPILLASEISGVFTLHWMLKRVGEVFRDQPELRESMEQRLVEILVDEVGHIAFNRMAVGPRGLSAARSLAPGVLRGVSDVTPEYGALGMDANAMKEIERFDLHMLPEEVRRRAYFV